MRHAMSVYSKSKWFWYLDQNSIIMNPSINLATTVLAPKMLSPIIRHDVPIVPPDSIIRTYHGTPPHHIEFILTQDHDGLNPGSFVIKQGDWARFFLDVWMDPLLKSYSFQKAEQSALVWLWRLCWPVTFIYRLGTDWRMLFCRSISYNGILLFWSNWLSSLKRSSIRIQPYLVKKAATQKVIL